MNPKLPLTALFFALAGAVFAQQQEIRVRASLEEKQIARGVQTYLIIRIEGGQPDRIPEVIDVPGLTIARKVYSPRITSINGVLKTEVTVMYGVMGGKAGKFEIPAQSFVIEGVPYTTEPQTIEIVEMTGQDVVEDSRREYFMTFKAAKTEAFVNELIPIDLHLYVRGRGTIGSAGRPQFENKEKFAIIPFPHHQYHVQEKQIDGIPFTSVRFPTRISALSPGTHRLGPASTEAAITRPMNTLFPRKFFEEPRTITSNDLEFTIKPLPEEGRPPAFDGTVGRFEMQVSATPTKLRVGDPIFLDIKVSGRGNFDSLTAPSVEDSDGWKAYQANRVDDEDRDDIEQTTSFNQVVIPTTEHSQLPPLELAFFDPEAEKYVVLRSEPIALQITPDSLTAQRAASGSLATVGIPSEQLDDILFIHSGKATWAPMTATLVARPSFWLWQLLPAAAFSALVGFWGQKRVQSWLARRNRDSDFSLDAIKSRLGGRVSRADFYEVVLEYFERNRERLAQVTGEARARLDAVYHAGNTFLYSGAAEQDRQPISDKEKQQAFKALGELDRLRPKTS